MCCSLWECIVKWKYNSRRRDVVKYNENAILELDRKTPGKVLHGTHGLG
jgi:hypothetical protein